MNRILHHSKKSIAGKLSLIVLLRFAAKRQAPHAPGKLPGISIKNSLIAAIFLFYIAAQSYAQTITSVSGTFNDGSSVTISGSGFGSKPQAPPITWMGGANGNIESGSVGANFNMSGWSSFAAGGSKTQPKYSNADYYSHGKSIQHDFYGEQYDCGLRWNLPSGFNTIYFTVWRRMSKNDSSTVFQDKIFRVKTGSNHDVTDGQTGLLSLNWPNGGGGINVVVKEGGGSTVYPEDDGGATKYWKIAEPLSRWSRIEYYIKRNSGTGQSNGEIFASVIGSGVKFHSTTANTHPTINDNWDNLFWSTYIGNLKPAGTSRDIDEYSDDIYLDITQARVELCTVSTWANRYTSGARCEIQPPTSWSTTSITFQANTTGWSTSQTAYLYVVDSNGNVNSNGYPVTIGGGTPVVAAPSFSPVAGTYTGAQSVTITTATSGASIRYTTDGSTPSSTVGTVYSTPVSIGSTTTLKAIAYKSGMTNSTVTTGVYTISDTTNPAVNIVYPATTPYVTTSQNITITGTASDNVGLRATNPIVVSCPQCESVGSVTGSTSWSVPVTLSESVGSDLISGAGTFDAPGEWTIGSSWSISGGVATSNGSSGNSSISKSFASVLETVYRFYYKVTSYTSGSLYLSQWGFPGQGNSILLNNSVGEHTVDVVCEEEDPLVITAVNWAGTLDNAAIRKIDESISNTVTITAFDLSNNSAQDAVVINFLEGLKSAKIPSLVHEGTTTNTEIMVYPNPANTTLTIAGQSGWTGMAGVAVYDVEGRKIYQTSREVTFPHHIDISSYVPGIYIVKVSKDGEHFMKKIAKE